MANPEHVRLVEQGAEAIAEWREQHPLETLDLSKAHFVREDLSGINLDKANLCRAVLHEVDFTKASLVGADLSGAGLYRSDLYGADLHNANLSKAHLFEANLRWANLSGAALNGSDLTGATLTVTDLSEATLERADLTAATFTATRLRGASLSQAKCWLTAFADCNLAGCQGLGSVVHEGPSFIDVYTLMVSFRGAGNRLTPELRTFFLGAGMPGELLDALPAILAEVKYCSCFIAYGEPDKAFAEKLHKDLSAKSVTCWFYPEHSTPGERTWKEIGEKRRGADKMVVLCSAQALGRDGVLKEIEEQIDEEPGKMVPVSLDNLWKERGFRVMRGDRDLKPFLLERNYADFSDPLRYQEALERLLKALERKQS